MRSLSVSLLLVGFAVACAPHSPKKGCASAKNEPPKKCTEIGVTCTPATITKTSVTCSGDGEQVLMDTDEFIYSTDELFCQGNKWFYRNKDPATGAVTGEKPVKGDADLNVACFVPAPAPG
ncbi:hypothetical protein PRIPAC_77180 [Pristionchus pacificus]|uniref:Uncharacterized protein n=1 Tax=Pristionchus pacificus TaxID=54126 RepID=A0A454Y1X7_PRIPA|nr:hypothetical protein PRIPAC_77180 [Pristionchus pacificus]|eukprot:PDM79305.1 hypothetical protein PRIPAC_31884 [Pristionchus pacificus]